MNERVSALMDGELEDPELGRDLARVKEDPELRRTWDTYHLIGDALRDHLTPGYADKLSRRLAGEPTVLAPAPPQGERRNPRRIGFKAAAAGLAAVALVAWMARPIVAPDPAPVAAVAPAPQAPAAPAPVAVGVENYLLAHQGYSPAGAMQGVAPYVRTVSAQQEGRGK